MPVLLFVEAQRRHRKESNEPVYRFVALRQMSRTRVTLPIRSVLAWQAAENSNICLPSRFTRLYNDINSRVRSSDQLLQEGSPESLQVVKIRDVGC